MHTREQLLDSINNGNLAVGLDTVKQALLAAAVRRLAGDLPRAAADRRAEDARLLDAAGPAWSAAAVDYAVRAVKDKPAFAGVSWNGNFVHNMAQVQTLNDDAYDEFGGSVRLFLARRTGRFDFDTLLGDKHHVNEECGYPRHISPAMYRYLYDRSETARRVNDIYPDESWAVDPRVYDDEDENVHTPFEEDWERLCVERGLHSALYRLDKLCGIGRFGGLLVGLDDGLRLDQPARGLLPTGLPDPRFTASQNVTFLRPFDEYLMAVRTVETDRGNPRYGMPTQYSLVFQNATETTGGGLTRAGTQEVVHWTRVIHAADNLMTGVWDGTPRMQPVFDRLLDIRKLYGGSAEMFWLGAFPGIAYEIDPSVLADNPEFDDDELRAEIEEYRRGLRRDLRLLGVKAHSLAPQVAEPDKHVLVQLRAIAMHFGIPIRIFLGSEEAKLASSQDKVNWNQRLGRRLRRFVEPNLLRPAVNHLLALRCLRQPKDGRYKCDWTDLNTVADEDKANLALKWTQALSQYVSTGIIHLIKPVDYMTLIMGLAPADALRIDKLVMSNGGYGKLEAVDPAKTAQPNKANPDQSGDNPDKRASGMQG